MPRPGTPVPTAASLQRSHPTFAAWPREATAMLPISRISSRTSSIHAIRYTYDLTRPFGPWLVTIAQRRIIDRLRRRGRLHTRETPLTAEHETLPAEQTNLVDEISDRRELHEAVEHLPASQREAIRLLKLKEMSLKEAAEATGIS